MIELARVKTDDGSDSLDAGDIFVGIQQGYLMTIKQIALPDVSGLASAGVTVFFMEAVTFSDDGKHLLVKATFVEDGTVGAQRYGYYLYDIANEAYVLNLNAELLAGNRLTTSNIEALSFTGNLDAYTCLLYTSPSPRDGLLSRMPSSA